MRGIPTSSDFLRYQELVECFVQLIFVEFDVCYYMDIVTTVLMRDQLSGMSAS